MSDAVLWLPLLGAAFALGFLALYLSTLGRGVVAVFVAAALVSLLVLVTSDLERPARGLIRVPAAPLIAERATTSLPPPATAPR